MQDALSSGCTCEGAWAGCAQRIFEQNDIPEAAWCQAMTAALQGGRAKGNLVHHFQAQVEILRQRNGGMALGALPAWDCHKLR